MEEQTTFLIQTYGHDFFAGHTNSGQQILVGLLCPEVVCFFFTESGALLRKETHPWKNPAPFADGVFNTCDPEFERNLTSQIRQIMSDLGFLDGAISVQRFFDEQSWVGIDMPENPSECDFIFYWAKDYWMDSTGRVIST